MTKYLLANKYNFDVNIEKKDETNRPKHKQSYLHFITERQDLVSAKCFATDWLFDDIDNIEYNIIEYFAGVGVTTTILKNKLKINRHKVIEIDKECYKQLCSLEDLNVHLEDGHNAIMKYTDYDIKICDWGHCTIVQLIRGKWTNFLGLFSSKPKYVCWTDTSISFPIKHSSAKIYAKELNSEEFDSYSEYFMSMSEWLFFNVGYSIKKVAYRGKNACYVLAEKGRHELLEKKFSLDEYSDGFEEIL